MSTENTCRNHGCNDACCRGTNITSKRPTPETDFSKLVLGLGPEKIKNTENFGDMTLGELGGFFARSLSLLLVYKTDAGEYFVQILGKCPWLTIEGCGNYENRPPACQNLQPGDKDCQFWRKVHNT